MTLSDISIRKPVFAWMLMAGLVLFGWISAQRMGVSLMPDVDFPYVTVNVTYEGASPEIMESDIIDPIEEAVLSVQGIKKITSTARDSTATISIEFDINRNVDVAMQEIQSRITQAQKSLPRGIDTPEINKMNPEDQPIMWIAVRGDIPLHDLMTLARDQMKPKFQTVAGVGEIFLGGYVEPNLRIWLDEKKLAERELTVDDVIMAIGKEHVEMPAGRFESSTKEYNIRVMGEAMTPEDFGNLVIKSRGGAPIFSVVHLKDVARVESGLDDARHISRSDGFAAVGLGIKKQRGANSVEVAHAIKKRMEKLKSVLPKGVDMTVNYDGTTFVEENTSELSFTLFLSALLTAVVCLLFLGSLRSAFNIVLAIPTSIVGTFIFLYFLGFTLNTFTLLGLVLAIGIVVDDAIMVLENIIRYQEQGKSRIQAALIGAREITPAALAATLAIIAVFLPVVFMEGAIGKFFYQFGMTLSIAVSLSLLEALTLTPMRAAAFVQIANHENALVRFVDKIFTSITNIYSKILAVCLNHRWKVVALSLLVFALSLFVVPGLKKEFVPSQDQSSFLIMAKTPIGSSLEFTDGKIKEAEKTLKQLKNIKHYYAAVGGFGGGEVDTGMIFVTMPTLGTRPVEPALNKAPSQTDLMNHLRDQFNKIPDLKVTIQDLSLNSFGGNRGYPVEISVRGPDWETLADKSQELEKAMAASKTFVDVDTNYKFGMPEVQIIPDRKAAAAHGVSLEDVSNMISVAVGGIRAGKFTENGRRNDIRVKLEKNVLTSPEILKSLFVRNNHGELVALMDIVKIHERKSLQSITREDRERSIGVYANLAAGTSLDKALLEVKTLAAKILPEGYRIVLTGSAESFEESNNNLGLVMLLGIAVAYMILGSQYNSFIHPFTVLLALPFSLSGALVALRVTGLSLNIFSFIGIILLMGIVKKNSILLVDFTNQLRDQGMSTIDALKKASPIRLRPILMTSFATIAGAIPPALALGPGAESKVPMSVAVIGGMIVSTLLTLFVVPCVYSLISRLERKKRVIES